jgi:hypothetical protein
MPCHALLQAHVQIFVHMRRTTETDSGRISTGCGGLESIRGESGVRHTIDATCQPCCSESTPGDMNRHIAAENITIAGQN